MNFQIINNQIVFNQDPLDKVLNQNKIIILDYALEDFKIFNFIKTSLKAGENIIFSGLSLNKTGLVIELTYQDISIYLQETIKKYQGIKRSYAYDLININTYEYYLKNIASKKIETYKIEKIIAILCSEDIIDTLKKQNLNHHYFLNLINQNPLNIASNLDNPITKVYNFPINITKKIITNYYKVILEYAKTFYLTNKITYYDLYIFLKDFNISTEKKYINSLKKISNLPILINRLRRMRNNKEFIYNNLKCPGFDWLINNFKEEKIDEPSYLIDKAYLEEIEINSELINNLYEELKSLNFNKIKQAYYIYRRLCQKLSYDDQYLVDWENTKINHLQFERIKQIDYNNNLVICHTFTLLYAKILEQLGIPSHIIDSKGNVKTKEEYFQNHSRLEFLCDGYLVIADAIEHVFDSDLVYAKLGKHLRGFICMNENAITKNDFYNEIDKVDIYMSIKRRDYKFIDTNEILEYKSKQTNLITIQDRRNLLINLIADILKNLKAVNEGIDAINDWNKKIMRNTNSYSKIVAVGKNNSLEIAFIAVFNDNLDNSVATNNYYIIEKNNGVNKISLNQLQTMFDDKILVNLGNIMVPGIQGGKNVSRAN